MQVSPAGPRGRGALVFGGLLVVAAMVFTPGQPAPALANPPVSSLQCQHPLVTGQEAVNIKNVSPQTACRTVRALARLIENGDRPSRLYECAGTDRNRPGRPVLKIRRFDGWSLQIVKTFGFRMSRGNASFEVTGQDFPINCS